MKLWLSYQLGEKMESRENKGSVKIRVLGSDNSDVYNDSSVESDTDESSDLLRPIGMLCMYRCSAALSFVCFLRLVTLSLGSLAAPSSTEFHWRG